MRKLFVHCLEKAGFSVLALEDGERLMQTLKGHCPDMVLLDVMMPKISGYDLVSAIRKDASLAGLKVVAVTNLTSPTDVERLTAAGFDGLIPKPVNPQVFAGKVAAFLEPAQGSAAA